MKKRLGIYCEGFFKVSRRIIDSSLWLADGDVIKVFLFLLERAQDPSGPRDGTVFIAREQLAARCILTTERLSECLDALAAPDPQSRTGHGDGRRIEVLSNGVHILNYGLYHYEARDRLLSQARSRSGKIGGLASAASKRTALRVNDLTSSKTQANAKQTPSKIKHTETETETETETTESIDLPAAVVSSLVGFAARPPAPTDIAIDLRYLACFNATFGRSLSITPRVRDRVRERTRRGYKPWQIVALPILVDAQGIPGDMRKSIGADVPLRDGKNPHTTNGNTNGATDWLERALGRIDQTVLNERLTAIAECFGVLPQLMQSGVSVSKDSGL